MTLGSRQNRSQCKRGAPEHLQKHHHAIMEPVLFAAVIALFLTKATALAAVTGYFLNH